MGGTRRWMGRLLAVALAGALVAGCGQKSQSDNKSSTGGTDSQNKEPIKIGAITHITGRFAFLGETQQNAWKLAEEEINKAGGIANRPVKIIIYDDEVDEKKTQSLTNRLLYEDKVVAIVGPVVTRGAQVAAPLSEKAKVLHVVLTASPTVWEEAKAEYVWQTTPREEIEVATMLDFVKNTLGKTKFGVIYDKQPYGLGLYNQAKRFAKEMGLTITGAEEATNQDTDVMPQLLRLRNSGAELVMIYSGDPMASSAVKQIRQINWDVPIIGSSAIAGPRFLELAGKASEGVYTSGVIAVGDPLPNQKPYVDAYKAKFGKMPDQFSAFAYDGIYLIKASIEKAGGKTDGPSLIKALDGLKFKGVTYSDYHFTAQDHNGLGLKPVMLMVAVKNGQWVDAPKK